MVRCNFPEALESADEFRAFARQLAKEGGKAPLVANMTEFGKTYLSVGEFEDLAIVWCCFPSRPSGWPQRLSSRCWLS
jgi:methylisocitrate lyase